MPMCYYYCTVSIFSERFSENNDFLKIIFAFFSEKISPVLGHDLNGIGYLFLP